jgi:hypothetical protein
MDSELAKKAFGNCVYTDMEYTLPIQLAICAMAFLIFHKQTLRQKTNHIKDAKD